MKAVGYIRVSTAEQAMHGFSLDAQRELLQKYADQHDMPLVGIYADEGVSASKALNKRKGILQLLNDAEHGKFDIILFKDLTRWSRNPAQFYAVQERLDRAKVSWIAIEQPNLETLSAQGKLMVGITISVSAHESQQTSERIKFVNRDRIKKGGVLSGHLPIGYMIGEIDGAKRVVINPEKKDLALAIFSKFEETNSIRKTAIYANEIGHRITERAIANMLRNTMYIGRLHDVADYCEPLIEQDRFDRIQQALSTRSYTAPTGNVYLFSSLLKCKECGRTLIGRTQYRKSQYIYYSCTRYSTTKSCTHNRCISESRVEDWLIENVDSELKKKTVEIKKQKKDPAPLRAKLNRVKELYIDGIIDRDEFDKRRKAIEDELEKINVDVPTFVFSPDWLDYYKTAPKEAKKVAWRSIIDHIDVDKDLNCEIYFR